MRRLTFLVISAILSCPGLVLAQDSSAKIVPSNALTTLTGVYTEQQASRGESIYRTMCLACHDDWDHTGAAFKQNWDTRTAFDLFEIIRTTMPNDNPGTLPREDYASIVAYLFKVNKMPSGRKPLPSDSTGLKQIVIAVTDAP
ncbi:MAG: c-type cytochrome [Gemmatimonadales bacterium]